MTVDITHDCVWILNGDKHLRILQSKHLQCTAICVSYVIKNNSKQEINNQRLNYSKISKELGWKQKISLQEGLYRTIQWYQKNLKLQYIHLSLDVLRP